MKYNKEWSTTGCWKECGCWCQCSLSTVRPRKNGIEITLDIAEAGADVAVVYTPCYYKVQDHQVIIQKLPSRQRWQVQHWKNISQKWPTQVPYLSSSIGGMITIIVKNSNANNITTSSMSTMIIFNMFQCPCKHCNWPTSGFSSQVYIFSKHQDTFITIIIIIISASGYHHTQT